MKTKYFLLLLAGLALVLPATRTLASTLPGGIAKSPHDFTTVQSGTYSWNLTSESTCLVCHTPHQADTTSASGTNVPLWAHANTTQQYTLYADPSGEMTNAGIAPLGQPSGISLACLSCHDGSLVINDMNNGTYAGGTGGRNGTAGSTISPSYMNITSGSAGALSLAGTHPISFTYPTNGFAFLYPPSTQLSSIASTGTGVTMATDTWPVLSGSAPTISTLLYNGKVECASCHDVHKQIGDAPYDSHLLKIATADFDSTGRGDTLCRTCHIK